MHSPLEPRRLADDDASRDDPSPEEAECDLPEAQEDPSLDTPARARSHPGADENQLCGYIRRLVDRDEQALGELYRATVNRVFGLALRIVRHSPTAEEVVEDAYWQAWRQAPRFDPQRGSAIAWLMTMTRSRALDALRQRERAGSSTISMESVDEVLIDLAHPAAFESGGSGDPLERLASTQQQAVLEQALCGLEPMVRQLIALAFLRGLTHEEIAMQTDVPLGTVKSHIRRGLLLLREHLAAATSREGLRAERDI